MLFRSETNQESIHIKIINACIQCYLALYKKQGIQPFVDKAIVTTLGELMSCHGIIGPRIVALKILGKVCQDSPEGHR